MNCRPQCGACCIAPSISSPIPGMPDGKPAGVRCIHLTEDYRCAIYDLRPKVCRDFKAEELVCGRSREEALILLNNLEKGKIISLKVNMKHREIKSKKFVIGKEQFEINPKLEKRKSKQIRES